MLVRLKEMADRWQVSPRRIAQLCAAGKIKGAEKRGRYWMVPEDAAVPETIKKENMSAGMAKPRTTKILPCPIGITSYKEAVTECYYVDKTLFIKDILTTTVKFTYSLAQGVLEKL